MIIVGAGMSGLLAGGMIRDRKVEIYEANASLPNNHSAVLRFRSSVVGDALDIPFKPVQMVKTVQQWKNPVADSLAYSMKTNGSATLRSILSADSTPQTRYIAPPNLIQAMADRINGTCWFNTEAKDIFNNKRLHIISTIPMPSLMKLIEYPDIPEFKYVHGMNINVEIPDADVYASIYVPDPKIGFNRISITGNRLTIEFSFPGMPLEHVHGRVENFKTMPIYKSTAVDQALEMFGLGNLSVDHSSGEIKLQQYSKILPIDEKVRRNFIMWATDKFNIYSLGRFATWRPGLLMDDVVNDVRVIRKIINSGNYNHRK